MIEQSVPDSRVYRHVLCGEQTVISGGAFLVASNPLADMTRTWCVKCNDYFPVSEYAWADTGEKISDYYVRHSVRATNLDRFLSAKTFMQICGFSGMCLGAVGCYFLFWKDPFWLKLLLIPVAAGVSGFLGLLIFFALQKSIARKVCRISDTRLLM